MTFPFYPQFDAMDCGPACLRMIAKYYGKSFPLHYLRDLSGINRDGVSLRGIAESAEKIGFRTLPVKIPSSEIGKLSTPCIVHWQEKHFVVLHKVTQKRRILWRRKASSQNFKYHIADPARGLLTHDHEAFLSYWQNKNSKEGIALLLEPSSGFDESEFNQEEFDGIRWLALHAKKYQRLLWQVVFALLAASLLQLAAPFLTQAVVDVGIGSKNINFIYLVVAAQLMLFVGRIVLDFIRSWILLHISARINVSILSEFFVKLMKLPLSFFDVKLLGDIIQRITDHDRIERFLTGTSFNTIFSVISLFILSVVLAYYEIVIFSIFILGSIFQTLWMMFFMGQRKRLDYRKFDIETSNSSKVIEMIQGMQDLKLSNSEREKRWQWEKIQSRLFNLNIKSLTLNQYQQAGTLFINETKNVLIILFSAKLVIDGSLTFGSMLAIQYIVGQASSPVGQLIQFLQSSQDARISLERLREVHSLENEDLKTHVWLKERQHYLNTDIFLEKLTFRYPGTVRNVIDDLDLVIPHGKVTAIVGMSGSGKTTLLKLLLKFYAPTSGELKYGDINLKSIAHPSWRAKCGVVLQDGFIFSDTILANISMTTDNIDMDRIDQALMIANLEEFIQSLPLGLHTKIGSEGNGLSQGQKQRVLIARAVYKNPEILFFDEATNALDANNESVIMKNLHKFFDGRTVVIVAHRLSTVRKADQILVLQNGRILEKGNHAELVAGRSAYYTLIQNQLELGD